MEFNTYSELSAYCQKHKIENYTYEITSLFGQQYYKLIIKAV